MCGPPLIVCSDPEDYSVASFSTLSTSSTSKSPSPPPSQPFNRSHQSTSSIERGILAERTIKAHLRPLPHENFASLATVAKRAMRRALKTPGKDVFVAPRLLRSPSFVNNYKERGWQRPGIRWGNFKPDLIRFVAAPGKKGDPAREVLWDVCRLALVVRVGDLRSGLNISSYERNLTRRAGCNVDGVADDLVAKRNRAAELTLMI